MILFMLACTSKDSYKDVLQSLGEDVFISNYSEVSVKTASLEEAVKEYCQAPEVNSLEKVQLLWSEARVPWKKMEFLNIGPYKEPDRLGFQIDFWPVRVETLEEVLYGEGQMSNDTILSYPAATKGFPGIEWLIYTDQDRSRPRYCSYLKAMAYDLHVHATLLHQSWIADGGNYLSHLTEAGVDKDYISTKEALTEVVNRLGHTLANIRALKLIKPLGLEQGAVQPELLESRYSKNSLRDIRSNLEGMSETYYGSSTGMGVDDLLSQTDAQINDDFALYLSQSLEAVDALDAQGSLEESMLIDPSSIDELSTRLAFLQEHIQEDILLALSLWLTFNDADGD